MTEKKNVLVRAFNRPLKVAFIVPHDESQKNQWILDGIFHESYTRWGGAYSLVIPSLEDAFHRRVYEDWLKHFDPDFIYSYQTLNDDFVQKIAHLSSPISFLMHPEPKNVKEIRWRNYIPDFHRYFDPVASLSTLLSPYSSTSARSRQTSDHPTFLVTQYSEPEEERFVADNFGIRHSTSMYTNERPGLYETLCYAKDLGKGQKAGTIHTTSVPEILNYVAEGKATTFANLSRIHSDSIPRVDSYPWNQSFSIFVGATCLDRINFWNSRHFTPDWMYTPSSLLVSKEKFDKPEFVTALGKYINAFNFLGGNNSQYGVSLRSISHSLEELQGIKTKFGRSCWSTIGISEKNFNEMAVPPDQDFDRNWNRRGDSYSFRYSTDDEVVEAEFPKHFEFNPPKFSFLSRGDWAVDLDVERHNNLSKYSNVVDSWAVPRGEIVCRAFTQRLSKVTKDHFIALIPKGRENRVFQNEGGLERKNYDLRLPSDQDVFRHLVLNSSQKDPGDARSKFERKHYDGLRISDKGQNLRGVISMFSQFSHAYSSLTNRLWREIIRAYGGQESVSLDLMKSKIPNDRPFLEALKERLDLNDIGQAKRLTEASFMDELEHLVKRSVIFQVHRWRCKFCGHSNIVSMDEIRKRNECAICKREYFTPIDLIWEFKFNSFVYRSLAERNGLTTLWALGHLRESTSQGSFYFLPEVDLFENEDDPNSRGEIDALCVHEGEFIAVEAKKSVTLFTKQEEEIVKFIKKMKFIRPDVALLAFEDYSDDSTQLEKIRTELESVLRRLHDELGFSKGQIRCVVGSELGSFNDYLECFGPGGSRSNRELYRY